jgi:hypothetical protein
MMTHITITRKLVAKARTLRVAGKSWNTVAARVGFSRQYILTKAKRYGIKFPYRRRTTERN